MGLPNMIWRWLFHQLTVDAKKWFFGPPVMSFGFLDVIFGGKGLEINTYKPPNFIWSYHTHMKTPWKADYWANFWTWNEDISGSRKAMNAFECAFESWGSILFHQKNFRVVEYSETNLQTKICNMSILANLRINTKSSVQKRGRWVIGYIFFLKEIYDDTFRKYIRWYPKNQLILKFWTWMMKI